MIYTVQKICDLVLEHNQQVVLTIIYKGSQQEKAKKQTQHVKCERGIDEGILEFGPNFFYVRQVFKIWLLD